MSSSYRPQSDGQTKVVNKSLKHYLRAFAADRPQSWVDWLSLAEFWFDTNFHTSLKLTPFEALYRYPPSKVLDYVLGTTRMVAVNSFLKDRQQLLSLLKHNLTAAQERMRWYADKKRVNRSFAVGDWVRARMMLLGKVCLICSRGSHTFWARCFKGEGIVRSVVCVCGVVLMMGACGADEGHVCY